MITLYRTTSYTSMKFLLSLYYFSCYCDITFFQCSSCYFICSLVLLTQQVMDGTMHLQYPILYSVSTFKTMERKTMFKYSYNSLVYYGEKVDVSLKRVTRCGYDALELYGEPEEYNTTNVRNLCKDLNVRISSICSIYTAERDLASPDAGVRRDAVDYVKRIADLASEVECSIMIVAPTACMKMTPWKDAEEERRWAIESIRSGGEYAASVGVNLTIEAWNRYETYFLNRLDQCIALLREIDLPNIGVMGDTFHMNIEEESIDGAFRQAAKYINHIHLADSNRAAPGKGHIDFIPVLQAIKDIGYDGYLSFELLPASADPFGTLKNGGGREFFDEYTKTAITFMKEIEKRLQ